jgi:hypothetical protein
MSEAKMPKRWEMPLSCDYRPAANGDWVRAEDVEPLAAEITRLRDDRRERIATACLASLLTHDGWERASVPAMALHAIAYADALIDELDWKAKP